MLNSPLRALILFLPVALAISLSGCNKNPEPSPQVVAELATQKERAKNAEVSKAEEARKREIAEKDASSWKTATMLSVIGMVVALIVGVGIGSRVRKQAERSQHDK